MMKGVIISFLIISNVVYSQIGISSPIKGVHVDGFISILGDISKEDSLLTLAEYNGVSYLALYDVFQIHTTASLTSVATAQPFADFIKKAKEDYGISQIGVIGENFWFFNTIMEVYNQQHPDLLEQVDVYSFEFPFWNASLFGSGGSLCTSYLVPNSLPCDSAGAFSFYINELRQIDSLTIAGGRTSETLLSSFGAVEGDSISQSVDRVLLIDYLSDYSATYAQIRQRLINLTSGSNPINVMPILNAGSGFLDNWLDTSELIQPYWLIRDSLEFESGIWKQYVNLIGVDWYSYSDLDYDVGYPAPLGYDDSIKGLYVDGMLTILGDSVQENNLLTYAQSRGFNYIALYDLFQIHGITSLTNLSTAQALADFISKAKTIYNIDRVGAIAENFDFFNNVIEVYNQQHSNPSEKFDVYNVEYEFWNSVLTNPSGDYCVNYLTPNGLSCNEAGAFKYYKTVLRKVDSLANTSGLISESYVGWFSRTQAIQLSQLVDRILLHVYVNDYDNIYAISKTRFEFLASRCVPVTVVPIFSSEPSFLGPWLTINNENTACSGIQDSLYLDTVPVNDFVDIIGCQWFAYSFMPQSTSSLIENTTEVLISTFPVPADEMINISLSDPSARIEEITIVDQTGRIVKSIDLTQYEAQSIQIRTTQIPDGMYLINVLSTKGLHSNRIIITH